VGSVFVVAEQRQGAVASPVLELCSAARGLAENVTAFVWGEGSGQTSPTLGRYGATRVIDLGHLGDSLSGPRVAAAISEEVAVSSPGAVFAAASYEGRDVAARLSARVDRPVVANVVGLTLEGGELVSSHMVFGGTTIVRARFTGPGPGIFIIRAKSFEAVESSATAPEVVARPAPPLEATDAARVVARHMEPRSGPSLDDAKVVVSGGRGLGGPERFALIEELAGLLGGAPAATRAIVDAGWAPYAYQVGQTGKTVTPDVYLAFGISGATQHLVGMKGANHIIAVNRDPEAPIMQVADLGVVGDVSQVLPKLVAAVKGLSG
jgi:electron transfer flavoprotein alpha subunit